jgi:hypothetical protein
MSGKPFRIGLGVVAEEVDMLLHEQGRPFRYAEGIDRRAEVEDLR